jgi:hypothetical protein
MAVCSLVVILAQCGTADTLRPESVATPRVRPSPLQNPIDVEAEIERIFRLRATASAGDTSCDMDSLLVNPVLVAYSTPAERLRVLAAKAMMCLGGHDHPLSERRIQSILLGLELVPWMARSEQLALEARIRDSFAAGVPSDGRLAQRLTALRLWMRWAHAGQSLGALLDALENDVNATQVTASHVVRWASSTTPDLRSLVDWIARVDYGARFAAYLPDRPMASSNDNVCRELALAQAWCCKRMKSVPASAALGYEILVRGRVVTNWYVAFDSLCDAEDSPPDLIGRALALVCEQPCWDVREVGFAAQVLAAFEADLRGSARADAARWLESEASRLGKRMLPTDVSRVRMAIETLRSGS